MTVTQRKCILVFVASVFIAFGLNLPATLPASFWISADGGRMLENSANGHSYKEVFHFSTAAVWCRNTHTHTLINDEVYLLSVTAN